MASKKNISRIGALILAMVMIFSVLPLNSLAEAAKVPAEALKLKDNAVVSISKDMEPAQIKRALFDTLVLNPEGASYMDYDWEVYGWAQSEFGPAFQRNVWVSFIEGKSWEEKIALSTHHFNIKPVKDSSDSNFRIRIAGTQNEVTIKKISTASIAFNYDEVKGTVDVSGKKVIGNLGSVSPAKDIEFKVIPSSGYDVEAVKVNGKAIENKNGVYTVTPLASTNVEVSFKENGELFDLTIEKGEGVKVLMDGNEVSGTVRVNKDTSYNFELIPDDSHSVLSVFADSTDITRDAAFKKYIGTFTKSFSQGAVLKVNTISVNDQIVLTDNRKSELAFQPDGDWDWGMIRQNLINNLINKDESINIEFSPKNFEFQHYTKYFTAGGVPGVSSDWVALEGQSWGPLAGSWYYGISIGNNHIRLKFTGNDQFRPTNFVELDVNIVDEDKSQIAIKENYEKNFKLEYNAEGEYDYEKLRREIFNAVVDLEKSTELVTYENVKITYQILDAMGTHTGIGAGGYYDFEQNWLGADAAGTYGYLYKGGDFNFKISIPKIGIHNANEIVVNLHVSEADRHKSEVILKSGSVSFNTPEELKKAVFNLIDFSASKLPENVTADNFKFEYYTKNYTAGDLLGVESWWVPFEGMNHPTLAGSYFKPIGVGTQKIRVTFRGNGEYINTVSNEATLTVLNAEVTTKLTRDYKFVDETLKKDIVETKSELNESFEHYFIMVDDTNPTAKIYIDSSLGLTMTDFTANIPFNDVLLKIFGIDAILSADEIYQRRGLTRDQMKTLLADSRFINYMQSYHAVDADACAALLAMLERLPETVNHFSFQMGQPSKAGTYKMMAITAKRNFNTAVAENDSFYVKFHSKGTKLKFMGDVKNINVFNAKNFDFSAVVTKNGVPVKSDHVRYLYTGFKLQGGLFMSTKNPPREAGIFYQLAYTGFGGRYAFPISRTFMIAL